MHKLKPIQAGFSDSSSKKDICSGKRTTIKPIIKIMVKSQYILHVEKKNIDFNRKDFIMFIQISLVWCAIQCNIYIYTQSCCNVSSLQSITQYCCNISFILVFTYSIAAKLTLYTGYNPALLQCELCILAITQHCCKFNFILATTQHCCNVSSLLGQWLLPNGFYYLNGEKGWII